MVDETIAPSEEWGPCMSCGRLRPVKHPYCGNCRYGNKTLRARENGIRKICASGRPDESSPRTTLFMQVGRKWRLLEVK